MQFDKDVDSETEVRWLEWEADNQNHLVKVYKEGTTEDPVFVSHVYTKRQQAASYNVLREAAQETSPNFHPNHALLQIDFSENYTCIEQKRSSIWTLGTFLSDSVHLLIVVCRHSASRCIGN